MTVAELIDELSKLPPDREVCIYDGETECIAVSNIVPDYQPPDEPGRIVVLLDVYEDDDKD